MFKKLLTIFLCLYVSVSFAKTNSTHEIGEQVYATASSLSLSSGGFLYVCYDSANDFLKASNCNTHSSIHNSSCSSPSNCYAGSISHIGLYYFHNQWFGFISKYQGLSKIIVTIDEKFTDIFKRLHAAQQHRKRLEEKFSQYQGSGLNYNKYLAEVDSDIRLLSSHGMALAKVTKRLIETIKPIIIDAEMRMDTIYGRKNTMAGLRSFEREMQQINRLPQTAIDESIQKIIRSIDTAIDELERTLAQ